MTRAVITVDGPSGVGKTTLGRRLAAALSLPLIDTGLFYRGLMVAAIWRGISPDDETALATLLDDSRLEVNPAPGGGDWLVRIDGRDAGADLRDPANAVMLSTLSQVPEVRQRLLPLQREAAAGGGVAVGRDCGTIVFPDADVKLYLKADAGLRRARRREQLGSDASETKATADVDTRDRIDAPSLAPAADAHVLDTGELDIEQTVERALQICRAAGVM